MRVWDGGGPIRLPHWLWSPSLRKRESTESRQRHVVADLQITQDPSHFADHHLYGTSRTRALSKITLRLPLSAIALARWIAKSNLGAPFALSGSTSHLASIPG